MPDEPENLAVTDAGDLIARILIDCMRKSAPDHDRQEWGVFVKDLRRKLEDGGGLPEPERREVLDRVVAQVAELGQLVASVTELARDESQPGPLGEVELHQVVEASLAGARRDWAQTVFTAELEPWTVIGSTESLQVIVRNLLDESGAGSGPGRFSALIGAARDRMAMAQTAVPRPAGAGLTPCCRKSSATLPAIHTCLGARGAARHARAGTATPTRAGP